MTEIQKSLFALKDEKYGQFQLKLIPGIAPETVIGVRVPALRKLAKDLYKAGGYEGFLSTLPHQYYDENLLHGLILSEFKDFDRCLAETETFLPFIDNWAVCDIFSPKVFKKHRSELLERIKVWTISDHPWKTRFGMEMLMTHFLDNDFAPEYLEIPAAVRSDHYYVNMMTAWFFATALAKQWDATIPYIENRRLDDWTHRKAIQKARESFRITAEQKAYLLELK